MTTSAVLILVMAVLFAAGIYAMLERSLTRVLIGFLLLGNAVNLLLLIMMGTPGIAPFHGDGDAAAMSDPLPQALTLTAIVITFAVSAFLLALIWRSYELGQADVIVDDVDDRAVRHDRDAEETFDDEVEVEEADDHITTDFVDTHTAPIPVVGRHPASPDAPHDDDGPPADPPEATS